jgi:hypothetical protein
MPEGEAPRAYHPKYPPFGATKDFDCSHARLATRVWEKSAQTPRAGYPGQVAEILRVAMCRLVQGSVLNAKRRAQHGERSDPDESE